MDTDKERASVNSKTTGQEGLKSSTGRKGMNKMTNKAEINDADQSIENQVSGDMENYDDSRTPSTSQGLTNSKAEKGEASQQTNVVAKRATSTISPPRYEVFEVEDNDSMEPDQLIKSEELKKWKLAQMSIIRTEMKKIRRGPVEEKIQRMLRLNKLHGEVREATGIFDVQKLLK